METLQVKAIKFDGYKIELSTNIKGKPVARFSRLLTAGKNKGTYKLIEGYYFETEEKRSAWIKKAMDNVKSRVSLKNEEIRNNFTNPFKVGDLFYDSWGYEQTNIDFYKIVEVKGKSVLLQSIGQTLVKDAGWLCEYVKPNPEAKMGEPQLKQVRFYMNDGKPNYYINGNRGSISRYTQGEKGLYQSHYA